MTYEGVGDEWKMLKTIKTNVGDVEVDATRAEDIERILKNLDAVKDKHGMSAIILYGSTARGTCMAKSDIDLFVIMTGKDDKGYAEFTRRNVYSYVIGNNGTKLSCDVDYHICCGYDEYIDKKKHAYSTYYDMLESEGKVIWTSTGRTDDVWTPLNKSIPKLSHSEKVKLLYDRIEFELKEIARGFQMKRCKNLEGTLNKAYASWCAGIYEQQLKFRLMLENLDYMKEHNIMVLSGHVHKILKDDDEYMKILSGTDGFNTWSRRYILMLDSYDISDDTKPRRKQVELGIKKINGIQEYLRGKYKEYEERVKNDENNISETKGTDTSVKSA